MKILVALSGGIDSSVVAHMLAQEGHELVGVRFTLWSDPLAPALAQILPSKCCNAQTAARAAQVAEDLGIPYHILDLEEEFKQDVVDPFLEGYQTGKTPNPCIGCNRNLKFGRLLTFMKEQECEWLATGHYARIASEHLSDGSARHLLLEAVDLPKDQSYYLYGLDQTQLSRILFPLGGMQKSEVYSLAKHFHIPYEDQTYRESQDLCFFPEKSPTAFLKRHLRLTPGPIQRRDGTVIGQHQGLPLYTIGQRRIGVGGLQIPLEVVEKDSEENLLLVADKDVEKIEQVTLTDLRWVSWSPEEGEEVAFECRTSSHGTRMRGSLRYKNRSGIFRFEKSVQPQAPGQSLVLYRGEEIVGGGVIS